MEDVPVNPVNQVSGSRETRCKTFMKQMAGDVFGEAFLDLYWPVNLLHCAIYICFGVSLSYSFLWFSRFAQAQCGKYRIFGGSTANCTFEVVGFLVYVWMTCLSVKLGTPPLEKVLPFNFQSITQNLFACFFGNFSGNALKKGSVSKETYLVLRRCEWTEIQATQSVLLQVCCWPAGYIEECKKFYRFATGYNAACSKQCKASSGSTGCEHATPMYEKEH